jgi:hypothetical protein
MCLASETVQDAFYCSEECLNSKEVTLAGQKQTGLMEEDSSLSSTDLDSPMEPSEGNTSKMVTPEANRDKSQLSEDMRNDMQTLLGPDMTDHHKQDLLKMYMDTVASPENHCPPFSQNEALTVISSYILHCVQNAPQTKESIFESMASKSLQSLAQASCPHLCKTSAGPPAQSNHAIDPTLNDYVEDHMSDSSGGPER